MSPLPPELSCLGLASSSLRPLREDERVRLGREKRSLIWRAALFLFATPIVFVVGLVVSGVAMSAAPESLKSTVMTVALLAALIAPALLVLGARDAFLRRRRIRGDLSQGFVAAFDGHPQARVPDTVYRALAREKLHVDGLTRITFEVLVGTGRLWAVRGIPSRAWLLLPLQEVAAVPAHAAVAAQWVRPVAANAERELHARARPLSDSERDELGRVASRIRRSALLRAARLAFFVAVWSWLLLGRYGGLRAAFVAVVGSLAAFAVPALGVRPGLRLAWALFRDRTAGVVHVFRARSLEAEGELSTPMEVLPASRVAWTENGLPALWRRAGVDPIMKG